MRLTLTRAALEALARWSNSPVPEHIGDSAAMEVDENIFNFFNIARLPNETLDDCIVRRTNNKLGPPK